MSFCSKNLLSALQHPNVVSAKLIQEVKAGRIAGPFDTPPFKNFCVSPLGVVPIKTPGEFRLIHHLSFPKGTSVNDGIACVAGGILGHKGGGGGGKLEIPPAKN